MPTTSTSPNSDIQAKYVAPGGSSVRSTSRLTSPSAGDGALSGLTVGPEPGANPTGGGATTVTPPFVPDPIIPVEARPPPRDWRRGPSARTLRERSRRSPVRCRSCGFLAPARPLVRREAMPGDQSEADAEQGAKQHVSCQGPDEHGAHEVDSGQRERRDSPKQGEDTTSRHIVPART